MGIFHEGPHADDGVAALEWLPIARVLAQSLNAPDNPRHAGGFRGHFGRDCDQTLTPRCFRRLRDFAPVGNSLREGLLQTGDWLPEPVRLSFTPLDRWGALKGFPDLFLPGDRACSVISASSAYTTSAKVRMVMLAFPLSN